MEKEESTKPYVYYERILNGIVEIPKTIQDKMANIILIKNQKKMEEQQKEMEEQQQKENQPRLFDSKPEEKSEPEEKPGFFESIFPKEEKPGFFDNLFPKKTEPEPEEPSMFDSLLTKNPVQEKKTDLFDNLFSSPKTNTKCKIRDW